MSRGSLLTLWLDFSPTLLLRIKGVKIMEKDKDFLGTEPIGKLLLRLAIPTLAAQLINMLYNVVDRIYIGHIPEVGALALTGVGVCMPHMKSYSHWLQMPVEMCDCQKAAQLSARLPPKSVLQSSYQVSSPHLPYYSVPYK